MRKLIVKRKNTFTASHMKVRIFIENVDGDVELGSVKCKEIGSLKNGETGEYEIPNKHDNIYLVYNKILPNDYYAVHKIPAGKKTIELFTSPTYSPRMGNSFEIYTKEDLNKLGLADGW
ncbi:MAG: hypothetical protein LBE48_00050 [Methanomassiliicoccaceae archaeon]|jgi:hypothetical protein|nr:hypothetical protein [Methanomassiliicoccaceae archaeon]